MTALPDLINFKGLCAYLQIGKTKTHELLKRHPVGIKIGRERRFTNNDVLALLDALRRDAQEADQKCHSVSMHRKRAARTSASGELFEGSASTKARALVIAAKQKRFAHA